MEALLIYLLKSSLSLALFYLFYWFFLRKETFYRLNRIYLLGSMVLSIILPFFEVSAVRVENPVVMNILREVVVRGNSPATGQPTELSGHLYADPLIIIYLTGILWMVARFCVNLLMILKYRMHSSKVLLGGQWVFLTDHPVSSFSFGRWIFIDKESSLEERRMVILRHENAHIRQLHTLDLVFSELLCSLFWFHPAVWLYNRSLREIHEYLADDDVINQGCDRVSYMGILMQQFGIKRPVFITNHFNQSLIKRRFIMITKNRSGRKAALKISTLIPLLTFCCFLAVNSLHLPSIAQEVKKAKPVQKEKSSVKADENKNKDDVYSVVEKMPVYPGGSDALMKYISENVKYPASAKSFGVESQVYISFIIDKEGNTLTPGMLRQKGNYAKGSKKTSEENYKKALKDMEDEAMRVVQSIPLKWTPGENKGEKVKVSFVLPIRFRLS